IQGGNRRIDSALSNRFIKGSNASISEKGFAGFVFCHFAIMEVEAWILGMGWYLAKHDASLTQSFLFSELDFDLEKDPEITEYHPARRLKEIYRLIGLDYDKHAGEVNSIMSKLEKSDFELLLELNKCPSFKVFKENLTR
ncbi:MAG: hypothetical protein K2H76_00040, partial [Muribaculaceae bacterium]|nr:hypothetical protein [Muribaculaceae bacterium]